MPNVSLLVPAYNEEFTIEKVLQDHLELFLRLESQKLIGNFEILVLDDGSSDRTNYHASKIAEKSNKIKIISNSKPSGLQSAFDQLYKLATFEWTVLTPGDGQWPAEGIERMIKIAASKNWESGIISIRENKFQTYTFYRFILSFLFRFYAYIVLREDIIDPGSIKLLPSNLNSLEYKTSSPLQEIERIRKFRQQNSNQLMFVKVPWAKRDSGKATGASIKTLESVFRDLLILVRKH